MLNMWQVEDLTKKMHPQDEQLSANRFLTFRVTVCVHSFSLGPSEKKKHQELKANGDVAPKTLRTKGTRPIGWFQKETCKYTEISYIYCRCCLKWSNKCKLQWYQTLKIKAQNWSYTVNFHQKVHPTCVKVSQSPLPGAWSHTLQTHGAHLPSQCHWQEELLTSRWATKRTLITFHSTGCLIGIPKMGFN